ncbi:MAG: preprotein translocase subunit SecG [Rikenellaceae bacterium]
MLYTICIGLVLVASVLMILAVLVQSPKSGMAANFGASNQVMGVRQTTDFLEKFTWAMAIAILIISLMATIAMGNSMSTGGSKASKDAEAVIEHQMQQTPAAIPQADIPAATEAVEEE